MNKELRKKTDIELCALILRLKLELLHIRFATVAGDVAKASKAKAVRETIAKAITVLYQRNKKVSIGSHGVTLYDMKTNKPTSITSQVQEMLKADATKTKQAVSEETVQVVKQQPTEQKDKDASEAKPQATPIVKKQLKTQMEKKAEKTMIHKTVGGGS